MFWAKLITVRSTNWFIAMVWCVWRVVTLRPAYRHLNDKQPMTLSFVALYIASGLLRWTVASEVLNTLAIIKLLILLAFILAIFNQRNCSPVITATLLTAFAIRDLTVCFGVWFGFLESAVLPGDVSLAIGVVWSIVMIIQFNRDLSSISSKK